MRSGQKVACVFQERNYIFIIIELHEGKLFNQKFIKHLHDLGFL